MSASTPKRRTDRLIVRDVAGESVVYDLDTDTVHALPEQTARLWAAADGTRSIDQLRLLAGMSEQEAFAVLAGLEDKGLMQGGTSGLSRRTVLQAAAVGAGALAVGSMAVPANAQTLASICIDQQPLTGSLCSALRDFFTTPPPPLIFPAQGVCTTGTVGVFDPRCPGFQIFYKETSSNSNISAIGNLKTGFELCRTPVDNSSPAIPDGTKAIKLKEAPGQSFYVYDPSSYTPPCDCFAPGCGIRVDLANTNNFIFGYSVPAGTGQVCIESKVCYPTGNTWQLEIWNGTVDSGGDFDANIQLANITVSPQAGCQSRFDTASAAFPQILYVVRNPEKSTSPLWLDANVTVGACPV